MPHLDLQSNSATCRAKVLSPLACPERLWAYPAELRAYPVELWAYPAELRAYPAALRAYPAELRTYPAELRVNLLRLQACLVRLELQILCLATPTARHDPRSVPRPGSLMPQACSGEHPCLSSVPPEKQNGSLESKADLRLPSLHRGSSQECKNGVNNFRNVLPILPGTPISPAIRSQLSRLYSRYQTLQPYPLIEPFHLLTAR